MCTQRCLYAFLAVPVLYLAYTGMLTQDRLTWLMEVAPVIVILPVVWATRRTFPLTPLLLVLIAVHAVILITGGMYTYAKVPIGFDVQKWLSLSRNPYDKLGHFFQGLTPTLAAREILLRRHVLRRGKILVFLVVCVALAISAFYELIEWWAALLLGQGADEFLGTQGDVWDTQSDMFCALLGSAAAVIFLARWHDRQLARLPETRQHR